MLTENFSSALELFKTRSPSLIGVDIASTSLKLVELSDAGKGMYRLERYVIEPLPKDVVTDGNILNIELASDVLKRAWKRLGSRNRNVALALPAIVSPLEVRYLYGLTAAVALAAGEGAARLLAGGGARRVAGWTLVVAQIVLGARAIADAIVFRYRL